MKKLSETLKEQGIDFQLPIEIKDSKGNRTYLECSAYCCRHEYDSNGNETYFENSGGYWYKKEYSNGKQTYFESSSGILQIVSQSCDGKVVEIDGVKYELKLK